MPWQMNQSYLASCNFPLTPVTSSLVDIVLRQKYKSKIVALIILQLFFFLFLISHFGNNDGALPRDRSKITLRLVACKWTVDAGEVRWWNRISWFALCGVLPAAEPRQMQSCHSSCPQPWPVVRLSIYCCVYI